MSVDSHRWVFSFITLFLDLSSRSLISVKRIASSLRFTLSMAVLLLCNCCGRICHDETRRGKRWRGRSRSRWANPTALTTRQLDTDCGEDCNGTQQHTESESARWISRCYSCAKTEDHFVVAVLWFSGNPWFEESPQRQFPPASNIVIIGPSLCKRLVYGLFCREQIYRNNFSFLIRKEYWRVKQCS